MFKKISFLMVICFCFCLMYSCGPKPVKPMAEMDTPEHHVSTGNKYLKANKLDDAFNEFKRAKDLDPEFSPAYVGLGLVEAMNKNYNKAFTEMDEAQDYVKGKDQESDVYVGYMRIYLLGQKKIADDWLDKVIDNYKQAILLVTDNEAAYFYMAKAYTEAYKFREAATQLRKVIDLSGEFFGEADKEYETIQKIERAMPGSKFGKKIALVKKLTRADIAALFIEELKIDKIFKSRMKKKFNTDFKSPGKDFKAGKYVKAPQVTDISKNVLKADIKAVLEIGIKGLEAYPDHTFKPNELITRAEFSMMLQNILVQVTHDHELATKFIGNNSPFPDIRSDLPYFNSVMVCITRGIMKVNDISTGEFDPMGYISGADALLSIRQMKIQLKKYY